MGTITHSHVTALANAPSSDVSADAWNANHTVALTTADVGAREVLTAPRTYYVRTDGNNSNNGLTNTAGGAFLNIQKACDVAATIDANGFQITIQIANGTYNESVTIYTSLYSGLKDGGTLVLQGNVTTPSNVVWNATSNFCLFIFGRGPEVMVTGVKFANAQTNGVGVHAHAGGWLRTGLIEFGACVLAHVNADYWGIVELQDNYTISGSAPIHALFSNAGSGVFFLGKTCTLTGTPTFTSFLSVASGSSVFSQMAFTGAATGYRFVLSGGSYVFTNNAGLTYFPGSIAGTIADTSMYDSTLGGISANPHGAADHTDISRTLWLGADRAQLDSGTAATIGTVPNAVQAVALADAATQGCYWAIAVPVDWASGSITVQPFWAPGATDAVAHTVRWSFTVKSVVSGGDATAAGTNVLVTGQSLAHAVGFIYGNGEAQTDTTVTPTTIQDILMVNLRRIGADAADTYVGVVNLIGVRLRYTANQ